MFRWVAILLTLFSALQSLHAQEPREAGAAAQGHVLSIFGWPDYIDDAVLDAFTAETGIEVRYETYANLPMLEAVLAGGHSAHDIVMPTNGPTLSRLVSDGLLAPIDRSLVPNWKNLDPALMRWVEGSDPGNLHGPVYLWGTLGLGLRPAEVGALAPDAPMDSLDLLFRPEHAERLAACGIRMLDSPSVVLPTLLSQLGHSPDSTDAADLADAERALMAIRPHIDSYGQRLSPAELATADPAKGDLAAGEICLALAYSGNVLRARARATAEGGGTAGDFDYVLPREGAQVTFDLLAIPTGAPNRAAAHAFIDFMLRPENIAAVTNATHYANAVPASHPLVDPDLLADARVFPPESVMATFFTPGALEIGDKMARNRIWSRFREGH